MKIVPCIEEKEAINQRKKAAIERAKRDWANSDINKFLGHMEKTTTTGEYKPRGVGKQKRKLHPTDTD